MTPGIAIRQARGPAQAGMLSVVLLLAVAGCGDAVLPDSTGLEMSEAAVPDTIFRLEQIGPQNPWGHLDFQNAPEDFSFAIVSDLTGGYRPGVFEAAFERLNWLRPEFVLSVGDLIEGYTEDRSELTRQGDAFDRSLDRLAMPFFYLVGNHDISNQGMADVWRERLGRDYYHMVYRNVLFLMLNTEDPPMALIPNLPNLTETMQRLEWAMENDPAEAARSGAILTGGIDWEGTQAVGISETQVAYFESVIRDPPDVRWTVLLMHEPAVWQAEGSEAFARIESALGDRAFTAFAGHTHNYKRFERGGRVHIRFGTTGGS